MTTKELRKALQRLDKCELKVVLELVNCLSACHAQAGLKRKQEAQAKKAAKEGEVMTTRHRNITNPYLRVALRAGLYVLWVVYRIKLFLTGTKG